MRVKRGFKARRRRNKVLERASGFFGSGSRSFTFAKERSDRAMVFAYRDRKVRKRMFRQLWIQRINAAARMHGTTYSQLMAGLKAKGIDLDRKVLADMAVLDGNGFASLVSQALPQ